jgi:hypothetical protein
MKLSEPLEPILGHHSDRFLSVSNFGYRPAAQVGLSMVRGLGENRTLIQVLKIAIPSDDAHLEIFREESQEK